MKVVAGLGNPGEKYEFTRHNAGFLILNEYVARISSSGVWLEESRFNSHIYRLPEVILIKPQTFMNKVGESISKILNYYKISPENLLVVHDDIDIKLGEFRYKKGSGSAGHHGVEDTFSFLTTPDFWRLRIGVGRPDNSNIEVEDFVLQKFTETELKTLQELFDKELFTIIDNFVK